MNIKLLPFDQFSMELPISCTTLLNRIDRHTHESSFGNSFNPLHKSFSGTVDDDHFKIRRSVEYQNSFSPIVNGHVSTNNDQCSVQISMRMHYFVMSFMAIWLAGALIMALGDFSFALSRTNAVISFVIGYWLMMNSFWKESKLVKEELNIIFKEL